MIFKAKERLKSFKFQKTYYVYAKHIITQYQNKVIVCINKDCLMLSKTVF